MSNRSMLFVRKGDDMGMFDSFSFPAFGKKIEVQTKQFECLMETFEPGKAIPEHYLTTDVMNVLVGSWNPSGWRGLAKDKVCALIIANGVFADWIVASDEKKLRFLIEEAEIKWRNSAWRSASLARLAKSVATLSESRLNAVYLFSSLVGEWNAFEKTKSTNNGTLKARLKLFTKHSFEDGGKTLAQALKEEEELARSIIDMAFLNLGFLEEEQKALSMLFDPQKNNFREIPGARKKIESLRAFRRKKEASFEKISWCSSICGPSEALSALKKDRLPHEVDLNGEKLATVDLMFGELGWPSELLKAMAYEAPSFFKEATLDFLGEPGYISVLKDVMDKGGISKAPMGALRRAAELMSEKNLELLLDAGELTEEELKDIVIVLEQTQQKNGASPFTIVPNEMSKTEECLLLVLKKSKSLGSSLSTTSERFASEMGSLLAQREVGFLKEGSPVPQKKKEKRKRL